HKGRLLYNLHTAKHAMRKAERAILVEGYFDVLRLSLAGIEEVVAPLGTGLTSDQAQLVQRHAAHVILLYDSDEAGPRATFRAAADPITRELYTSRAAEAAGVRKDVLEREVGSELGARGSGLGTAQPRPPSTEPRALPASAEKTLLLLMLEGDPWKSQVRG